MATPDAGTQATDAARPGRAGAGRLRVALVAVAMLALACGALWLWRTPILSGLARWWVVEHRLKKADAIIVLGGGKDCRPAHAAKLYAAGWAPQILVMDVQLSPTDQMEITPSERTVTERILLKRKVPREAIVPVGSQVGSTYDESLAVRDWAHTARVERIIIVTEPFHTRRACWLFRKVFAASATANAGHSHAQPIEILVSAASPWGYDTTNWWRNENGLLAFQNEVLKFVYYKWRY